MHGINQEHGVARWKKEAPAGELMGWMMLCDPGTRGDFFSLAARLRVQERNDAPQQFF